MRSLQNALLTLALSASALAQQKVTFATDDGARICGDLYGKGRRAVVLAHGGRFTKESWRVQAEVLVKAGFRVLAIDLRAYGCSTRPAGAGPEDAYANDVLGAVRYLRVHGARSVSVVGGSMGGAAAGDASVRGRPGEIDRVVMLGAEPDQPGREDKIARAVHCGSGRFEWRGAPTAGDPRAVRKGTGTEGTDCPGGFRACSVSVPDGTERSGNARNPPVPFGSVNATGWAAGR